jgi:hypothetical protein
MCSRRVNSCFACDILRVTLATNSVINEERIGMWLRQTEILLGEKRLVHHTDYIRNVSSRVQCSIKDCFGAMWKWFCSESCSFWTVYYNVLFIFRFFFTMFSSIKHIKYCKEKMKNIKYNNVGTYFKNKNR